MFPRQPAKVNQLRLLPASRLEVNKFLCIMQPVKKPVKKKKPANKSRKEKPGQNTADNQQSKFDFGGLPDIDPKKLLGCG